MSIADINTVLQLSDNVYYRNGQLSKWMKTVSFAFDSILIKTTDIIVKFITRENKEYGNILFETYMNLDTEELSKKELIKKLGMDKNTYYRLREPAITRFSKYFFLPSGELYYAPEKLFFSDSEKDIEKYDLENPSEAIHKAQEYFNAFI